MSETATSPTLTPPVSARDHRQGPLDAPVTLVEYGDYECPSCGQAHAVVQALQQQMGEQVGFVFRNFPLSQMHPHAQHAAEAAEIAAKHGAFWKMHDALYAHQRHLEDDHLREYAHNAGIPREAFVDELTQHVMAARVHEDYHSGVQSGVNGTPMFFINGVRYDGRADLETLQAALQAALSSLPGQTPAAAPSGEDAEFCAVEGVVCFDPEEEANASPDAAASIAV